MLFGGFIILYAMASSHVIVMLFFLRKIALINLLMVVILEELKSFWFYKVVFLGKFDKLWLLLVTCVKFDARP